MAHLDSFLRELQAMDAEKTLTISSQELPGIEAWENGRAYDITIVYRGAVQMQKIFTGAGAMVVMKIKGSPVFRGMPAQMEMQDMMRSRAMFN